ncbi:MAG: glutamate mutase L [Candidatus Riflebacteria bacterium]|nr:glutamate mutase L [Candidatus Riflebacteria bacterium]
MTEIETRLAVDFGSTLTKVVLLKRIQKKWIITGRGESATTVERPFEDINHGLENAIREIQPSQEFKQYYPDPLPKMDNIDITKSGKILATSSAGGGLKMLVAGVSKTISAESATKTALGAGAVVQETIALDDGRQFWEKIELIKHIQPDLILISGGTEKGATQQLLEIAEIIYKSDLVSRFQSSQKFPIIFAGNSCMQSEIEKSLGKKYLLEFADNIRPSINSENFDSSREKIRNVFLKHVMSHAPGFDKIAGLCEIPPLPTPGAVGDFVRLFAKESQKNVLLTDIGGATTDVFSILDGKFHKSISANIGMSYSLGNVLFTSKSQNIMRWLPPDISIERAEHYIKNKIFRPTSIPSLIEDLILEQACAREAIRISFQNHLDTMKNSVYQPDRLENSDPFGNFRSFQALPAVESIDMIIGIGGVFTHAPRYIQKAMIILDSFLPVGICELAIDRFFLTPQLGVLSKIDSSGALDLFEREGLQILGTCISPIGIIDNGKCAIEAKIEDNYGNIYNFRVNSGEVQLWNNALESVVKVVLKCAPKLSLERNPIREKISIVKTGKLGLIFDARGRPFFNNLDAETFRKKNQYWTNGLKMYP